MRYLAIGVLLAAVASSAHGQAATWGTFESGETKGIGIQSADGSQLLFKCDKPGKGEVYVMAITDKTLVEPAPTYVLREAKVRVDDKPPYDSSWRFYEHYVVAIDKGRDRTMTQLMRDFGEAQKLELLLYPNPRNKVPVTLRFEMAGTAEALKHIYEACEDTMPTG